MFENPFREGGDLSKDAEVIIDALKTGKLSVIGNRSCVIGDQSLDERDNDDKEDNNGSGMLVEPRERKNASASKNVNDEVDVQWDLVLNTDICGGESGDYTGKEETVFMLCSTVICFVIIRSLPRI